MLNWSERTICGDTLSAPTFLSGCNRLRPTVGSASTSTEVGRSHDHEDLKGCAYPDTMTDNPRASRKHRENNALDADGSHPVEIR